MSGAPAAKWLRPAGGRGGKARLQARLLPALVAALAALITLTLVGAARAEDTGGIYGRFDGDLELHLGAGAALAEGGPVLCARAEALYLSTAGIYAHYTDALGNDDPTVRRSIASGLRLQPLFLGRFAKDLERGPARLDLLIDSIALDLGAFWHAPRGGSLVETPGLEVALGLGVPLFAHATGPVLGVRGALRWRAVDLDRSTASSNALERGALLSITLSWHHIVTAHIVDPGDRVFR